MDRLAMVMKALTPHHVDVVVCLAKKLKGSPELGGEEEEKVGWGGNFAVEFRTRPRARVRS